MSTKWTPAQRQKFRKTMAAKRANKKTVAVIPLEAIPERRVPSAPRVAGYTEKQSRLALALLLVKTVQELIK